ncbi:MAG: RIO1 family regulatory kinase/ATPase [Candidatus Pacearchaeota archaeon]
MKIISQGAEAKILFDEKNNLIIKDRISKSYRIKEIDEKIRKHRTKTEKKLLEKACKIINAPNPLPLKDFDKIKMPFIKGKKLSENLDLFPLKKQKEILKKIGEEIAKLHDADIIHGDLTTSNMILVEDKNSSKISSDNLCERVSRANAEGREGGKEIFAKYKIFFIDFGLGYISNKIEDKAVDLHLLKHALEARHFKNWKILFSEFEDGYKKNKDSKKILERLIAVEKRGRYKER